MSYEPTNWKSGDVVTSAKLNKLEQGVAAGGVFVVTATEDNETNSTTLNKSYNEIKAAMMAGQMPVIVTDRSSDESDAVVWRTVGSYESGETDGGGNYYTIHDAINTSYTATDPEEPLIADTGGYY